MAALAIVSRSTLTGSEMWAPLATPVGSASCVRRSPRLWTCDQTDTTVSWTRTHGTPRPPSCLRGYQRRGNTSVAGALHHLTARQARGWHRVGFLNCPVVSSEHAAHEISPGKREHGRTAAACAAGIAGAGAHVRWANREGSPMEQERTHFCAQRALRSPELSVRYAHHLHLRCNIS